MRSGAKMGLPAGVFEVEYLNETNNHLAVVPVKGSSEDLCDGAFGVRGEVCGGSVCVVGGGWGDYVSVGISGD